MLLVPYMWASMTFLPKNGVKRCFSFLWSISAKELLMVSRKEDSTSFFAALLMSGTCNYHFLLSVVNSLIY